MKVVETSKADAVVSGAAFLAGHLGHIIAGARLLTQQKVAVPNCAACWSLHRRGFVAGLAIILTAFGLFAGFASMDQETKLRMPVWVTFAAVVGLLVMAAIGGAVSSLLTARASSVFIYHTREDFLYYEFWSPRYQENLKTGMRHGGSGVRLPASRPEPTPDFNPAAPPRKLR